jgi:HD-GYP domain-containing protein (c-di-GMP phosphodiesterase class II)
MLARWTDGTDLIEARGELAEALIGIIPAGERTPVLDLLARSFVDTYATAVACRRHDDVLVWAQRMHNAHGDSPLLGRLLDGACGTLDAFMARERFSDVHRRPLRSLEASLRAVARGPRAVAAPAKRADGLEAAIGRTLHRLEAADPLTAQHSRDVAAWCERLAEALHLSESETRFASRCGLLHDIGKITTPSEILNAPRSLSRGEWSIVRDHPAAGEILAAADPHLAQFRAAIRGHHERLDGLGYPDGLKGDQIALTTRLVTVADCYSAMTGPRPYRTPLGHDEAMDQLARGAGTQFDSEVVRAAQATFGQLRPAEEAGRAS